MSTPNNEPERAFPHHETTSMGEPYHDHLGMTLRDYFAAQALTGILMAPGQLVRVAQNNPDQAALWAYGQADAMLFARNLNK
jgi:hypothetical protein